MTTNGTPFVGIRAAQIRATSAQADAPVVEPSAAAVRAEHRAHRRRTRTPWAQRTRVAVAHGLHRAADAVAPRTGRVGHPVR